MRGWLKATIGLVVLSGLLVGADRIAVGVAEDQVAEQLVKSGRMSQRPDVSIGDVPFLTDLLSKEVDDLRISADGLTVGDGTRQVALHSFKARLSGVKVSNSLTSAKVAKGSGSGLISYADLTQLLPPASQMVPAAARLPVGTNTRLSLSYGGPGKIKAALGGLQVGEGSVHSQGNTVTADGFRLSGVAAMVAGLTDQKVDPVSFTLDQLPAGLKLSGVTPQEEGLQLTFQGDGVTLIG
ncbi:LmeA family phospholipid-binding protein [Kitasatospora sp. NPDC003701]